MVSMFALWQCCYTHYIFMGVSLDRHRADSARPKLCLRTPRPRLHRPGFAGTAPGFAPAGGCGHRARGGAARFPTVRVSPGRSLSFPPPGRSLSFPPPGRSLSFPPPGRSLSFPARPIPQSGRSLSPAAPSAFPPRRPAAPSARLLPQLPPAMPPDCSRLLLILGLSCCFTVRGSAAFGWFLRPAAEPEPEAVPTPRTEPACPGPRPQPPFEMSLTDQRFVAEAPRPELDSCQQAVIAELTSSCSDLSEEELSKLGVSLFNCQAAAEHRQTYLCTADMALAECTKEMDPDTWNAYHIVSNRARALCYAARQQDFKRRTEMTVNSLAATASSQLEVMKILKDGQKELRELTASSLEKVVNSQNVLLLQQEQLQGGQQDLESSINGNLEKLTKEKELIASGHQQVAKLIEGITLTMENVSKQLAHQDLQLQESHQAILTDLLEVRARAHQVYTKLESNLALFSAHQSQTAIYYDQLMDKLQKMNQTVGVMMHMISHLEKGVSMRLNSIQYFLNWTGANLHVIYTCVVHVSYFLATALIMTFLQTPGFSRAVLLVLVVLNALSEFNRCASLDFKCLSLFLTLTVIGNWMLINCFGAQKRKSLPGRPSPVIVPSVRPGFLTSTPERKCSFSRLGEELEKLDHDGLQGNYALENADFIRSSTPIAAPGEAVHQPTNQVVYSSKIPASSMPILKKRLGLTNSACWEAAGRKIVAEDNHLRHHAHMFEAETFNLNDSAASSRSTSQRQPCSGITRTGLPCRNKAAVGQEFCRIHSLGQTSCS
ncbi:protein brambleberry [Pristis pectinata]|uniref:protein brambleberry n=1 Tax=Pristis pectinata TaxID=685728 RepID=UPI00223DD97E|nr:protein brambleberry [Pristis pectinata]